MMKMKPQLRVLVYLLGMSSLLAACTRAAAQASPPPSRLEQITQIRVMRVGVAVDAPPFVYLDRQGERQGFDIDLMGEIARRVGVEVEWVDAAYIRLPEMLRTGKLDAAVGAIACSIEWEEGVEFSLPYHQPAQPAPPGRGTLCILIPPGQPALAEKLHQMIAELAVEGFIERLNGKYLYMRKELQ
ncbi:MAG: hypothetical protein A2W35_14870 [Chloroflexi bacterium RBG_16_57_11]|nr:MAG: hypothetical protein A2W35_14870 [Chloroflexi bacterium RBG_16_57_11]